MAAWRLRALSRSGAGTAIVAGTVACAAGWSWAVLLVAFFAVTSALSRLGGRAKEARTRGIVAKGGMRDWRQVAANGGAFVAAAAGWTLGVEHPALAAFGLGSLAAAAADSWATEIGTLWRGQPRSVLTWRPLPPGSSGAVSLPGTIALVAGAVFVSAVARALGWSPAVTTAAALGGIGGAILDSLLGATVQLRRWCPTCGVVTERALHPCGSATERAGGLALIDNDAVNLACAIGGGLLAALVAR